MCEAVTFGRSLQEPQASTHLAATRPTLDLCSPQSSAASSVTLATAWRPSTKSPLGVMKREDERLGSVPVSESERAMLQDSIDQLELTFN